MPTINNKNIFLLMLNDITSSDDIMIIQERDYIILPDPTNNYSTILKINYRIK